jgi:hypothetical protein
VVKLVLRIQMARQLDDVLSGDLKRMYQISGHFDGNAFVVDHEAEKRDSLSEEFAELKSAAEEDVHAKDVEDSPMASVL